jgi:hypothetical protein
MEPKKFVSLFPHRRKPLSIRKINAGTFAALEEGRLSEDLLVSTLREELSTLDLTQKTTNRDLEYLARNRYSEKVALTALNFMFEKQASLPKEFELNPKRLRSLIHIGCYESVALIVQKALLEHDDVGNDDLRYLAQFGRTLKIALMATEKLAKSSDDPAHELRTIFARTSKYEIVRKYAETFLLSQPNALPGDRRLAAYRKAKASK